MSEDAAVAEFSAEAKELGDKIAEMTLKQAKELSDYLKDVHGIEPAAGGAVVMGGGGGGGGEDAKPKKRRPNSTSSSPASVTRS